MDSFKKDIKCFCSPSKFYIGDGILNKFNQLLNKQYNTILFICGSSIFNELNDIQFFERLISKFIIETLIGKYCTNDEIKRISNVSKLNNCDLIVGVGGGNIIDCAKAVANDMSCPFIVIPSIPSNDSPSTSLSVINNEYGEFESYLFMNKNADIVIADTSILIKSPFRFISAGVGDAIATYYESRSCFQSKSLNLLNTKPTITSLYLSESCFKIIQDNIESAYESINKKIVSESFSNLIESIVFLSGVGAESGGISCAHAIANGLSSLNVNSLHGENVAFGLIVQSVLENWDENEFKNLIKIYLVSKLPITLNDLGIDELDQESIFKVAKKSNLENETMSHMINKFNNDDIYEAIIKANSIGLKIKSNSNKYINN